MSSSADRVPANQDSRPNIWQDSWPAIVRIIVLEILLLIALAGAFVYYLSWSSDAAVSDFMAHSPSVQAAKVHPSCDRSA
jgi:uncharacterized membrane protein